MCDCPFPGSGCKHTVAALLDTLDILDQWRGAVRSEGDSAAEPDTKYLTPEEIRQRALEDREKRARNQILQITYGDMFKMDKRVRIRSSVRVQLDRHLMQTQAQAFAYKPIKLPSDLKTSLFPYQEKGIRFGLNRQAVLIGDEMGLGKTIQAIVLTGTPLENKLEDVYSIAA